MKLRHILFWINYLYLYCCVVRSFGTEDRPTDRPVLPRDEVFEYIIFRGSDIEDLHVCEPYPPQAKPPVNQLPSSLIQDPAIVKTSAPPAPPSSASAPLFSSAAAAGVHPPSATASTTHAASTNTTGSQSNAQHPVGTSASSTQVTLSAVSNTGLPNAVQASASHHNQRRSSPTQDSSVQVDSDHHAHRDNGRQHHQQQRYNNNNNNNGRQMSYQNNNNNNMNRRNQMNNNNGPYRNSKNQYYIINY